MSPLYVRNTSVAPSPLYLTTNSVSPIAVTNDAQIRDAIVSPGHVTIGTPAHNTSVPCGAAFAHRRCAEGERNRSDRNVHNTPLAGCTVVWALHAGVSRKRSATCARRMYPAFAWRRENTSRDASTPAASASRFKKGMAAAGKCSIHSTDPGTCFKIRIHAAKATGSTLYLAQPQETQIYVTLCRQLLAQVDTQPQPQPQRARTAG